LIYLIISVLAASLIFVIFKLFAKYQVDTLQAIIVNYVIACISGMLTYSQPLNLGTLHHQKWFWGSMILALIFISVFNLIALTTQRSGLSVAAVATKMSVAIPILFGIVLYQESLGVVKMIGILLGLVAVYLVSIKTKKGIELQKKQLIFPILVFIGSGIIDTSLKYLETNFVAKNEASLFSASIFGFAAIIGIGILGYKYVSGTLKIKGKNIIGGIFLGVPNYYSIYFLIKALQQDGMDSSSIFTINNVAILLVSTLAGILFFQEKLTPKNWLGISIAILSIILVTLSL